MANCLKATPPPTDRSAPRYLNTCLAFLTPIFSSLVLRGFCLIDGHCISNSLASISAVSTLCHSSLRRPCLISNPTWLKWRSRTCKHLFKLLPIHGLLSRPRFPRSCRSCLRKTKLVLSDTETLEHMLNLFPAALCDKQWLARIFGVRISFPGCPWKAVWGSDKIVTTCFDPMVWPFGNRLLYFERSSQISRFQS